MLFHAMPKKRKTPTPKAKAEESTAPPAPDPPAAPLVIVAESLPVEAAVLDAEPLDAASAIARAEPVRQYLNEIRRHPRITRDEEHELAVRFKEKGDTEAAYRLVTANLRLVVRIAMDYRRSYLNLLDLIQEGNVGLLQAIRKYDPYRGVPLSAYAGYWIRAYMLKYLLDHWSLVRVATTNARRKLFFNLKREQQRLRSEGIDPGPKLLAANLDAAEHDVIEVAGALKARDLSIDQPAGRPGDEDGRAIWETMAAVGAGPEEEAGRSQMQEILKQKIAGFASGLKEKERYILENRLVAEEPMTLQAIGDRFGTTREAVRQVEERLVKRLKEYLKREIRDLRHFEVKED